MSLRPGNNKKQGQKYQNTYKYKHNKHSMTTRKILSVPLDYLCEHCIKKIQWRLDYRKYKPLTTATKCNICQRKTIYKAYRTICEECATKDSNNKLCTKCGERVDQYAKPDARNDPSCHVKKFSGLLELIKKLKKKFQKTVYRKMNSGVKIDYDERLGIIDISTKEVIIPLDNILKSDIDVDEDNDLDDDNDDIDDILNAEDEEDVKEVKNNNNNICDNKDIHISKDIKPPVEEEINTSSNK